MLLIDRLDGGDERLPLLELTKNQLISYRRILLSKC
jgi:hypothetical protein